MSVSSKTNEALQAAEICIEKGSGLCPQSCPYYKHLAPCQDLFRDAILESRPSDWVEFTDANGDGVSLSVKAEKISSVFIEDGGTAIGIDGKVILVKEPYEEVLTRIGAERM